MSDAGEVTLVARYQVSAGRGDEVAALLGQHVAATRGEPGCLEFTALRSAADPDAFVLYERYASRAALDAHRASPHFETIVKGTIVPLLDERVFDLYRPVPAADDPA
jgi:quinol monooxygenase YgiN